jgi:putative addiction module killer protein
MPLRGSSRIRRMEMENPGDAKGVGKGVMEMRIDYGPGYRVHYTQRSATIVVLLCAGDKRTQSRDIKRAQELAERQ